MSDSDQKDSGQKDGAASTPTRAIRKRVVGVVVSDKMNKTISVRSDRKVKHPKYGKYIKRHTIYKVHDENESAALGDVVEIVETRPLSKTKHWNLAKVVKSRAAGIVSG